MAVSATERTQLITALQLVLGDTMTNTLMEFLPPEGWADVARAPQLEKIEVRLEHLDSRMRGLVAGMWAMGSIMSAAFIAIFVLLASGH